MLTNRQINSEGDNINAEVKDKVTTETIEKGKLTREKVFLKGFTDSCTVENAEILIYIYYDCFSLCSITLKHIEDL